MALISPLELLPHLCGQPVVIPMPEATWCYGFAQGFSFNLHKEPGTGAGAKPIPTLYRLCRGITYGWQGLAFNCDTFLPIRASFCLSPLAGGLGWGHTKLSHCP